MTQPLKSRQDDIATPGKRGVLGRTPNRTERLLLGTVSEDTNRKLAEYELRLFKFVSDNSNDAHFLLDRHARFLYANRVACMRLGYSEEELRSLSLTDIVPPGVSTRFVELFMLSRRQQVPPFEAVHIRKDGKELPVEVSVTGLCFDGQDFVFAVARDIAAKKEAELQLNDSRERVRYILEATGVGTWDWHIVTGEVTRSENLEAIHGRETGSFDDTFNGFLQGVHSQDRGRVLNAVHEAIVGNGDFEIEYRGISVDGKPRWFGTKGRVIHDRSGHPIRMAGICFDVTERRQVQQMLQELAAIVESSDDAIICTTLDGIVTSWNAGAERIYGYQAEEMIGEPISVIYHHSQVDDVAKIFDRIRRGEHIEHYETKRVAKCGRVIDISIRISPVKDTEGVIVGASGIARDISELKQARRRLLQSERLAAIGEAITGLAHESRNALQRSQASLEMLARRVSDQPDALELIERIQRAQDDLHQLYEQVREYAAPIQLDRQHSRIEALVNRAWEELAAQYQDRTVRFRHQDDQRTEFCSVDPFAIRQVFRNILENSLAACTDPVEIEIRYFESQLGNRRTLGISVSDNGPGLNREQSERLFDAFYTTKTRGTGLGMAIAKRLIEAHGGTIKLVPHPGSGACFRILLPYDGK